MHAHLNKFYQISGAIQDAFNNNMYRNYIRNQITMVQKYFTLISSKIL